MADGKQTLTLSINVELPPGVVSTIVQNAKKIVGPDARGHYKVDTHEVLSRLISRFLNAKDFESYAGEIANYD